MKPKVNRSLGRKIAFYATYGIVMFCFTLLSLEFFLRMGIPKTSRFNIQSEAREKGKGPFRLLILGDSFTTDQAGGAMTLLSEELRQKGVVTINAGESGTGPLRYLENLSKYQDSFRPNVVVVNYYAGNDLTDTYFSQKGNGSLFQGITRLFSSSFLFDEVRGQWHRLVTRQRLKVSEDLRGRLEKSVKVANPFLIGVADKYPDYIVGNLLVEKPELRESWKAVENVLITIRDRVKENGGKLLINVFPSTAQVNSDHFEFYRQLKLNLSERTLETQVPQDLMASFCARKTINCFDLLPSFRARKTESFYLEADDHWNSAGNRLAFESVLRKLEELQWMPTQAQTTSAPASSALR